jgi:hypothetical protein
MRYVFQKEAWAAQVLREATLATGAGGSGQAVVALTKSQLDRKLNMSRLAQSFDTLSPLDYLQRAIDIMGDEM